MNGYEQINGELGTNFNVRMLRVVLGVALTGTFLAGIWATPVWIFAASVLAIYLVVTAILGKGILEVMFESSRTEEKRAYAWNLGNAGRAVRGTTAGVALGGVLGDPLVDAYLLNAFDIFALNVVGVYLATTAIIAWDPVNALFRVGAPAARTTVPRAVGTVSGTGRVAEPEPVAVKRAA